jgi:hypothetical protein
MFNLADVLAHFRRGKHPDPIPMQGHSAETGSSGRMSDETREDFEGWRRYWERIQPGIDELVAHLGQNHSEGQ